MSDKIEVRIDSDLEELIPGFLANRKKDVETLQAALDNKDFETIQSIGHSIKGVGGGYGFHGMSEIGAELEQAGKASDAGRAGDQVAALEDYMSRIEVVFE